MRKKHKAALMVLIVVLAAGILGASMSQKKSSERRTGRTLKGDFVKSRESRCDCYSDVKRKYGD